MRRILLTGFMTLIAALGLVTAGADNARANGVPQLVKLSYLEGVSNFGPKDAEGVLEFSFAEAYARVDVKNLKADGYTFEGWLMGGSGAPLLVGAIPVDASGVGTLDTRLKDLQSYDYNLFVITARATGGASTGKPETTSIAGRFAIIGDNPANTPGDVRPGQLPDTGEKPAMSTKERLGRTITISAAAGGLAFAFVRIMRRRRVSA